MMQKINPPGRKPLDKDLFFARDGDIFQVITNVHPPDRVVALWKYHHTAKKPRDIFSWHSSQYPGYFTRSLRSYNAQDATVSIAKSKYSHNSLVFGVPMTEVPSSEIVTYLFPEQGLQDWLGKKRETEWGKYLVDIVTQFRSYLGIEEESMGITGSLLWGGQHAASDIDLVIFGSDNVMRFIRNVAELLKKSSSIHQPPQEFIERYAGTLAKKTGLKLDLTTQYIAKKPYYLYYKNKFLSLGFVPRPEEVTRNYGAYSFRSLVPIKVRARVREDRFGYFYPGEYKIETEDVEIKGPSDGTLAKEDVIKNLTTLLLMEREISGFYFPGDVIEIHGMLQAVREGTKNYFQVMVGTRELYGNEWVKIL